MLQIQVRIFYSIFFTSLSDSDCTLGKITIYGPDAQSVQKAREQLELVEDSCPVTDRQADWFSDKMNASYLGTHS
jgi:hypothetical protein